jgi:hypothetical protein
MRCGQQLAFHAVDQVTVAVVGVSSPVGVTVQVEITDGRVEKLPIVAAMLICKQQQLESRIISTILVRV